MNKNLIEDVETWDAATCVSWLNLLAYEFSNLHPRVMAGNKASAQKMRVLTLYFQKIGKRFRKVSKEFPIPKNKRDPDKNVVIFKGMIDKLII